LKVKVKYFGNFRRIIGLKEETLTLQDGATLRALIDVIAQRHGPRVKEHLFTRGQFQGVMLDGRVTDDLDIRLKEGATVVLMPFIVGGYCT
jgi:MoaD family protein